MILPRNQVWLLARVSPAGEFDFCIEEPEAAKDRWLEWAKNTHPCNALFVDGVAVWNGCLHAGRRAEVEVLLASDVILAMAWAYYLADRIILQDAAFFEMPKVWENLRHTVQRQYIHRAAVARLETLLKKAL